MSEVMKALAKAIVAAQAAVQAVQKADTVRTKGYSYSYASTEDIITEARDCLHAHGLAFLSVGWDHSREDAGMFPDDDGKMVQEWDYWVRARYILMHEFGEALPIESDMAVCPGKGRPLDKALAAALTYDLGYTLRGLLLMPRTEEEPDQRNDSEYSHRRAPAKPKPRNQVKADTHGNKVLAVLRKLESKFGITQKEAMTKIGAKTPIDVSPDGVRALIGWGQRLALAVAEPSAPGTENFDHLAPPNVS